MTRAARTTRRGRSTRSVQVVAAASALLFAAALPALADTTSPTPSTSASSASAAPTPSRTTFTVGVLQDVDSLNPFVGIVTEAYEIWGMTYDQLLGYSQKDFAPVPGLAESWQESADHKTWTYKIRSGVKWSDGQPLTARDAAYTFNRILKGSFEQTNYGNYVTNITSATAPDDTTLVLTVKSPTPIMLRLAVPILPEHIWKNIDDKKVQTFPNQAIVGSGPFTLLERKTGQFLRLKANKNYWAGAPKVDEVDFRVFSNEDAAVQALKKGEIDFIDGLSPNPFQALEKTPGVKTVAATYSGFDEIAMNTGAATAEGKPIGDGHPALKDKRVRQAISHALDLKVLVDRVLGGRGTAGDSIIPPLYPDMHYTPDQPYGFDPAKANQILDDAGYAKGSDGIRKMPGNGRKLSFRLFGRSSSQTSQQTVQFVKGWLHDIGIDSKVSIIDENRLTEVIGAGEYDMFEWGWVVEPDPDYQLSTFTCGQRSADDGGTITPGLSDSFYCNPAYDALYLQQSRLTDLKARADVVKQAEKLLYDDVPYVVTFVYDELQAYRSDRFAALQAQPPPKGVLLFQYGTYTYRNITPVADVKATSSSSSSSTGLTIGAVVAALIIVGTGAVLLGRRRRATADDRE